MEDPEQESDTDVTGTNVKKRELNVFEKFSIETVVLFCIFFSITIFRKHLSSAPLE